MASDGLEPGRGIGRIGLEPRSEGQRLSAGGINRCGHEAPANIHAATGPRDPRGTAWLAPPKPLKPGPVTPGVVPDFAINAVGRAADRAVVVSDRIGAGIGIAVEGRLVQAQVNQGVVADDRVLVSGVGCRGCRVVGR